MSPVFMLINPYSHPSIVITRARHDESTSNLVRHVKSCEPASSTQTQALAAYASGSQYNEAKHRMKCALWIARRARPFSIVEDPELLDIFSDLNAGCVTPKRKTISRDIKEIWELSHKELATLLQVGHLFFISLLYYLSSVLYSAFLESSILSLMAGHLPM